MEWWEANRDRQRQLRNQWMIGLPAGLVLGLPILLNLFSDWNKRIDTLKRGQLNVLLIAVLAIIAFVAIFTVRHRWDMREQHYRELKEKQKKAEPVMPPEDGNKT
jgi:uncharacterized membrane protein YbhN (UPF0104 family)